MSYYRGKSKVLVTLGGIALALVPCLQQTHAVCRLLGCMRPILAASADAVAVQETNCDRCCGGDSESPCQKPPQNHGGNVPCGPDCWCTQAPDPREAPRNSAECAKSSISTLHVEAPISVGAQIQLSCGSIKLFAPSTLPSLSAGKTCVLLCRFLT